MQRGVQSRRASVPNASTSSAKQCAVCPCPQASGTSGWGTTAGTAVGSHLGGTGERVGAVVPWLL